MKVGIRKVGSAFAHWGYGVTGRWERYESEGTKSGGALEFLLAEFSYLCIYILKYVNTYTRDRSRWAREAAMGARRSGALAYFADSADRADL